VEEWHIPGETASKRVHYRLQTRTAERLSARHQTVLATFLGFKKPLYSCTEGMCHSSTRPSTSYHAIQFYQAFPRVSTASDTNAGARRPGYEAMVWLHYSLPAVWLSLERIGNTMLLLAPTVKTLKLKILSNRCMHNPLNLFTSGNSDLKVTEMEVTSMCASYSNLLLT